MASNDPIASKSRKPALSVEDAERFASQIRPSWELLGPEGSAAAFGQDDAPGVAAPAAGSVSKASDTIIEGIPTVAIGGSEEAAHDDGWGDDEPKAAKTIEEAEAPPIEAKPIASIGITSKAEVPASELPLPPQVGHPMVPTPGAPVAPSPPAKTKLGIGGTSGERAPIAKPKPTRSDASIPIPAPVSAKAAVAPAAAKTGASRSRPGTTNPGVDYVPAASEAGDDIEIPISGAPKGLLLKIGGGVAAIAVLLLAIKLFSGSSKVEPVATAPTATVAAVTPPTPAPPEPPKTTAPTPVAAAPTAAATTTPTAAATTTPTAVATTAPTAAATTAPTAKEKPVVAKVEAPPPVVKKPAPTSGGSTPPAGGGKKSGGIIRETPF